MDLICIRLADVPRFRQHTSVEHCAECGDPVVHNAPDTRDVRFVCMQCLEGGAPRAEASGR